MVFKSRHAVLTVVSVGDPSAFELILYYLCQYFCAFCQRIKFVLSVHMSCCYWIEHLISFLLNYSIYFDLYLTEEFIVSMTNLSSWSAIHILAF